MIPAGMLFFTDMYLNNRKRFFYKKQEYPIVRAFAALTLLALDSQNNKDLHLDFALKHLNWLAANTCQGYSGACWGLGFRWAVSKGLIYEKEIPFITVTPYALEAMVNYQLRTGDLRFIQSIKSVYDFIEKDIKVLRETQESLAVSYGPFADRIVTNATSYYMFTNSLLIPFLETNQQESAKEKVMKCYSFLQETQSTDGSWVYSPQGNSFIDCFHSCIVLKNIIKTNQNINLKDADRIVAHGYSFLKQSLWDSSKNLFRRFAKANKPTLIKYDLYDNAEMLNLAILMKDDQLVQDLSSSIRNHFVDGEKVYSSIDWIGKKRNPNMLRWAIMPYLYALSQL